MAHGVYRLGGASHPLSPFHALAFHAAGNLTLFLYDGESTKAQGNMKIYPPGADGAAGHVFYAGFYVGNGFFLRRFDGNIGGKFLCKIAASQGISLGIQIQDPYVAGSFATKHILADVVGR